MERITLQQIEIFLRVANCHNISQTAREMYISQPALSNCIRNLEESVGATLFVRSNRGVNLTPEGMRLFGEFDPVYQRFRVSMETILDQSRELNQNTLRVGSIRAPDAVHAMGLYTERYQGMNPGCTLQCELYNYGEVREKLLCGDLDVAFTMSFDVVGQPGFRYTPLAKADPFFVAPMGWELWENGTPNYKVLQDKPLLLEVNNGWNLALDICRDHGFEPGEIKFYNSYLTLSDLVAGGQGFTLGSYFTENDKYLYSVKIVPAPNSAPGHEIHTVLLWRDCILPQKTERFLSFCKEECHRLNQS